MGYGTSFTADMYISRERFETEHDLEVVIEETKKDIQSIREKLLMACIGGKDSFSNVDCEGNICNAVDVIHIEVNNMLDYLLELNDKLFRYELLKENFKDRENT